VLLAFAGSMRSMTILGVGAPEQAKSCVACTRKKAAATIRGTSPASELPNAELRNLHLSLIITILSGHWQQCVVGLVKTAFCKFA
jgi:hypothetical protein